MGSHSDARRLHHEGDDTRPSAREATPVARLALVLAVALAVGACGRSQAPSATPDIVAIPTQPPPANGTPAACMAALIRGTLVADPRWGLAIRTSDGSVIEVLWPFGFAARRVSGGLVLLDAAGAVIAREGDRVELGGGEIGSGPIWLACGEIRILPGG